MEGEIKVLMIDDDREEYELIRLLMSKMKQRKYRLDWTGDFDEGLGRLRSGGMDVCLLDYMLGGRSGLELLNELEPNKCEIPIILLTRYGSEDLGLQAMKMGAMDYLEKDRIDPRLLDQTIRFALERNNFRKDIKRREKNLQTQNQSILDLTRGQVLYQGDFEIAVKEILQICGRTLETSRVGVWFFNEDKSILRSHICFERETGVYGQTQDISLQDAPAYFQALRENRSIFIHDAFKDPRSAELSESYLKPLGIHSLLDVPIRKEGKVIGVLCHEQRGSPRCWSPEEQQFAGTMADFITLALEHSEKKKAQTKLMVSKRLLETVFQSVAEGIFVIGADAKIQIANTETVKIFGYSEEDLIGKNVKILMPEPYFSEHDRYIDNYLKTGVGKIIGVRSREVMGKRKDGSVFPLEISVNEMLIDGQRIFIGTIRDITARKLAEDRLRIEEERFRILYNHTPAMLHSIGPDGRIVSVSDYWLSHMGYSREEVIGRKSTDFLTEESARYAKEVVLPDFMNTGSCLDVPYQFVKKNGEIIDVLLSATSERDEKGTVIRSLAVSVDVTEREKAQKELRKTQDSLLKAQEIAHLGSWERDLQKNMFTWSDGFFRIMGYSPQKIVPSFEVWLEVVHPEDRDYVRENIITPSSSPPRFEMDYRIIRKDGSVRFLHVKREVYFDTNGKPIKIFGIFQDITERKKMEEALRRAKEEAEKATELKNKFLSFVSHDLKSPLNSMMLFLQMLQMDREGLGGEGMREDLEMALATGQHMTQMINELLDQGRFQAGQFKVNPKFLDAHKIGEICVKQFQLPANEKGIHLQNEIPKDSRIFTDFDLFKEVIQNLVGNAIKFCGPGNHVTLSFHPGNQNVIAVRDDGPAIPPNFLPHLFSLEEKTTTLGTKGEKGTGLGLPFCQEIMQILKGQITVQSEVGKGTIFYVEFPFLLPKVLLVDDDEQDRQTLSMILKKLDVSILEAENGKEALDITQRERPHLIITDVKMPVMDGFELFENLKKNHQLDSIPVIFFTALNEKEMLERTVRMGADDFIFKSVRSDDLILRIKRFIG